ncbi:MAG: hypothetical protein A2516_00500 [Alphaproteobacteria bacterium RIFOXYD12_FULL_60_8]|nr:MAG: hypothetical protein A2516_00500 [Alphaproteobacteria bacterium RIFOXYD12_FULL_60_8]
MTRPTTFLWIFLIAAAGIGVLMLKHNVEALEIQLQAYNDAIKADQEAMHVLKAEWSYLNDPSRLRSLAESQLGLSLLRPDQVTTFADLPKPQSGQASAPTLPGDTAAAPPNEPQADGTVVPRQTFPVLPATPAVLVQPPQGGLNTFMDKLVTALERGQ